MDPYIFDLDNPIETLDKVPQDLQSFFTQTEDGSGYVVADSYKPVAQRLNGLSSNLEETRKARTQAGQDAGKARQRAKALEEIFQNDLGLEEVTPDAVKEKLVELQEKASKGGKGSTEAAQEIERIKSQMAKDNAQKLQERDEVISKKDKVIEKLVKRNQISDALSASEAVGAIDVLRSYIESRVQVQYDDEGMPSAVVTNENGETMYNGQGNPMSVAEYVSSLKEKEEYAPFFKSQKTGGFGTQNQGNGRRQTQTGQPKSSIDKIGSGLKSIRR